MIASHAFFDAFCACSTRRFSALFHRRVYRREMGDTLLHFVEIAEYPISFTFASDIIPLFAPLLLLSSRIFPPPVRFCERICLIYGPEMPPPFFTPAFIYGAAGVGTRARFLLYRFSSFLKRPITIVRGEPRRRIGYYFLPPGKHVMPPDFLLMAARYFIRLITLLALLNAGHTAIFQCCVSALDHGSNR